MAKIHSFRTGCRYHTQDFGDSCGAAVATMILSHQGVPYPNLPQKKLRKWLREKTNHPGWACSPEALALLLSLRHSVPYRADQFSKERQLALRLVHAVVAKDVPVSVAVTDSSHWVTVDGVQTHGDPVREPYTLLGAWIHNPVQFGRTDPPPHGGIDRCGSGGKLGVAEDFYTTHCLMTELRSPDSAPFRLVCVHPDEPPSVPIPRLPPPPPTPQERISAEQAIEIARAGFLDFQLRPPTTVESVEAAAPLFVERLAPEQISQDYYVVPWLIDNLVAAVSRVDATRAVLLSVAFLSEPFSLPGVVPASESAVEALVRLILPGAVQRDRPWWTQQVQEARLVWRSCPESYSPYFPIREIPLGPEFPGRVVYLGPDLRPVYELTKPLVGG